MTPTPKTAEGFKTLLYEADVLAKFSNLNTEQKARDFQSIYPEFVPKSWWTGNTMVYDGSGLQQPRTLPSWTRAQEKLRMAWVDRFPPTQSLELLAEAMDWDRIEQIMLPTEEQRVGWERQLDKLEEYETDPNSSALPALPPPRIYPYQRAIMFLAVNAWRAKFCKLCHERFVAGEPKQGLCSETCRHQAERNRQSAYWKRSGEERRRKRLKQELRRKSQSQQKRKER